MNVLSIQMMRPLRQKIVLMVVLVDIPCTQTALNIFSKKKTLLNMIYHIFIRPAQKLTVWAELAKLPKPRTPTMPRKLMCEHKNCINNNGSEAKRTYTTFRSCPNRRRACIRCNIMSQP
jgi:hypothetical protein